MAEQNRSDNNPRITHIILPSGKIMEVFNFIPGEEAERELHICPDCESNLVQPICQVQTEDPNHPWHLELACPNCFWAESGDYTESQAQDFEQRQEEGHENIVFNLRHITQLNMTREAIRFAFALRNDYILPEDF